MGAVKELLAKGPDLDELVWWAKEYVMSGLRKPYAEIKRYAEEFDMTPEQFKSFCNIHLNMDHDDETRDVLREIVYHIESEQNSRKLKENIYQNKINIMKDSIEMPRFKAFLNEDHHKECGDEVGMAKIQLKSIMKEAGEILNDLEGCEELDAWVQSKLSIAEDYLTTIRKYMEFEEEEAPKELPLVPAEGPGPEVIDEIPAENPEEDPEPVEEPMELEIDDIEMPALDLKGPSEEPDIEDLELFSKEEEVED